MNFRLSKYSNNSLLLKFSVGFILTFACAISTNAQETQLEQDTIKIKQTERKDSLNLINKKDSQKNAHVVTRSTINDNKPLLILDGKILTELEVKNFDSKLIEKIDVLKGVAASALYGMRGQNGVVLITSKKKTLKKE